MILFTIILRSSGYVKITVEEDNSGSLILKFSESDRAIAELIKDKIAARKGVEFAGVVKEHPEIDETKLIVKGGKSQKQELLKAIEELQQDLKELEGQIPKK